MHDRERLAEKLEAANPGLLAKLANLGVAAKAGLEPSRSGDPTIWIEANGSRQYLHSRFDPRKEAKRAMDETPAARFVVLYGLGAGHHLAELLNADTERLVAVVEPEPGLVACALGDATVRALLADERVTPILCMSPEAAAYAIEAWYRPYLDDSFALAPFPARTALDLDYFKELSFRVRSILDERSADLATQARFGLAWVRNSLRNLVEIAGSPFDPGRALGALERSFRGKEALVLAAGPSIDSLEPEIARRARECPIVACDTSLPWLSGWGIEPALAVTIDCQQASMHHYLSCPPLSVPLLADLSVSSSTRRAARSSATVYAASGHPFHALLARRFSCFPGVDASGGNVAHTAVSAALGLGAKRVTLYGADFSYPSGASYARGTYLHRYFAKDASRTRPLESRFFAFPYRSSAAFFERDGDEGRFRYRTPLLDAYRSRLERSFPPSFVSSRDGSGMPKRFSGTVVRAAPLARGLAPYPTAAGLRAFLEDLARILGAKGLLEDAPGLSPEAELVRMSVLVCARDMARRAASGAETERRDAMKQALESARSWLAEEVDVALASLQC